MTQSTSRRAGGFSLVELLLALVLGLVVVSGIVQLFVSNSRTYDVLNGQARMQESARFALEFISRAARSAGFLGCSVDRDNLVWGLWGDPQDMPEFNVDQMVEGLEGQDDGTWSPALTNLPTDGVNVYDPDDDGVGIATGYIVTGSDVLVLRSVQRPGQRLVETLQPTGNPVVTAPNGDPGFGVDDMVIVSDCEQGALFRVTGMNVAGTEATLLHATTAAGGSIYENAETIESPTGDSIDATLSFLGRSYGPESSVGRLETTFFYIAEGAGTDRDGDAVPALWQKVGRAAPVELIQGIEDMQVLYGVDTVSNDGSTGATRYVTFDDMGAAGVDAGDVVSLRVSVTATSVDAVGDGGQVLRRTFTKTILLRNADTRV